MQQEMVSNATEQTTAGAVLDALRTVFHAKILRYHIKMVQSNNLLGVDVDKLEDTDRLVRSLVNELKRRVPQVTGAEWLEADVSADKLFMASTLVEMIAKIGVTESQVYYEEFADMVVGFLDDIFYAQKTRKRIHFSKYKAMIELFRSELKADLDHQSGTPFKGQLVYKDKVVWFRANPLLVPSQNTVI